MVDPEDRQKATTVKKRPVHEMHEPMEVYPLDKEYKEDLEEVVEAWKGLYGPPSRDVREILDMLLRSGTGQPRERKDCIIDNLDARSVAELHGRRRDYAVLQGLKECLTLPELRDPIEDLLRGWDEAAEDAASRPPETVQ